MPRELVAVAPRQPVLREYEDGPVPADSVRIQVEFGAPQTRHRTDGVLRIQQRKFSDGTWEYVRRKKLLKSGTMLKVSLLGKRVTSHGHLKETHTWRAGSVLKMPDQMSWKEAVCYDPLHFAMSAIRDGKVRVGERVAVFGLGAIGLMTVQMARVAGADFVAAVDPLERRRKVAEKTGAELVIDPTACNVGEVLKEATGGLGVDVAVETSAIYEALDDALRSVTFEGTIVYAGRSESMYGWTRPRCCCACQHSEHNLCAPPTAIRTAIIRVGISDVSLILAGSGSKKVDLTVKVSLIQWCRLKIQSKPT